MHLKSFRCPLQVLSSWLNVSQGLIFARASPHGSTSPSLSTKHFHIHLLLFNVPFNNCWTRVRVGCHCWWRGRCFQKWADEPRRLNTCEDSRTRSLHQCSQCDETEPARKAALSVWYLSQHATTSIASPMRSQGMCSAIFLLGSRDTRHLRRAGGGWRSQWALVKIIFPLWALLTRPRFK